MNKRSLAILIVAALASTGCATGMHMKGGGKLSHNRLPVSTEEDRTDRVSITEITPELILQKSRELTATFPGSASATNLEYTYRIGPRDILTITVWDHPELTIPAGQFRSAETAGHLVNESGDLFYPYVGLVRAAGKTVDELRRVLTRDLATYIENPQLDVRVAAYRSQKVYVVGEVKQPGVLPITDVPLTVVEAINRSGGVNLTSDMTNVTMSRDGRTYRVDLLALYEHGDVSQNHRLQDGDVLNVPDLQQNKVFVLGEVLKPSSQLINKGRLSLAEALSDSGGVNPLTASAKRIYVIRGGQERSEIFHLNARSPDALLLADRFPLIPRDVIYVDSAGITRWNRFLEKILPAATLLNRMSDTDFPLFNGNQND